VSLKHRVKRIETKCGTDKPVVLYLRVPSDASDEEVERLKKAELDRLGIKDEPGKLIIFLVVKFV
jgi:hypothetical protein